jgi:hypothetical protein
MNKTAVQSKSYDAVQTMREIREKLSQRYWQHTDVLKSDLEKVKTKRTSRSKKKY